MMYRNQEDTKALAVCFIRWHACAVSYRLTCIGRIVRMIGALQQRAYHSAGRCALFSKTIIAPVQFCVTLFTQDRFLQERLAGDPRPCVGACLHATTRINSPTGCRATHDLSRKTGPYRRPSRRCLLVRFCSGVAPWWHQCADAARYHGAALPGRCQPAVALCARAPVVERARFLAGAGWRHWLLPVCLPGLSLYLGGACRGHVAGPDSVRRGPVQCADSRRTLCPVATCRPAGDCAGRRADVVVHEWCGQPERRPAADWCGVELGLVHGAGEALAGAPFDRCRDHRRGFNIAVPACLLPVCTDDTGAGTVACFAVAGLLPGRDCHGGGDAVVPACGGHHWSVGDGRVD